MAEARMTTLAQVIAIDKGTKTRAEVDLTEAYQRFQKSELLFGLSKVYQPLDEENGERLPPESKKLQVRAEEVIVETTRILTDLFDVTAIKDWTNCVAKADVMIDGEPVLEGVPATYLLFLEKQLINLRTFVDRLPVLDPSEEWEWSNAKNCYVTKPIETVRNKKEPKVIVKYEATKEHPAQTELVAEDRRVGMYTTVKMSGAMQLVRVNALLERVEKLQRAVKFARETANSREAIKVGCGKQVFDYLFPPPSGK